MLAVTSGLYDLSGQYVDHNYTTRRSIEGMSEDFDDRVPTEQSRVLAGIQRRISAVMRSVENLSAIFCVVVFSRFIGDHVTGVLVDRRHKNSRINTVRSAIHSIARILLKTTVTVQLRRSPDSVSIERLLRAYEFVIVDRFTGDLMLSPSARREWWNAVLAVANRSDPALLSEIAGDRPTEAQFQWVGDQYTALDGEKLLGSWPSRSAFLADAAADQVFRGRLPYWDALSTDQRSRILTGFRLFLDECPTCEGEISVSVGSTHGSMLKQPIVGHCRGCNDRLFECFVVDEHTE